jgi:Amt family ammonium transporter
LSGVDGQISMVAVNTLLAGAMGGITAMGYMWLIHPLHKPEPGNSVNGILAGLVAITAPCAFVSPWDSVLIGGIAGVVVCLSAAFFEKRGVDDPVGAVSVHGVNGAWGILALGLFANGSYGDGWNGVSGAVRGLFYGDGGQLLAQSIDVVVNVAFVFGLSYLFFKLVDKVMGLRSKPADEINGLDVPEMGTPGYVDDETVKQPGALPRSKAPEFGTLPVTGK